VGNDELSGEACDPAEPVLLPGMHERPGRARVSDGCAGRREREPPPRALAAALDRPGRRSAAAGTLRRCKRTQARATVGAQKLGRGAARGTAARQEEVDEPRHPRYGRRSYVSVPSL
jgi:hypothetical protein